MKKYYAAYGSNLNPNRMRERCPGAEIAGRALVEGFELLFRGSRSGNYLTIGPKEGASVPAGIWEITEEDEKALDRYEGVPKYYEKKEMELEVTRKGGAKETLRCLAYVKPDSFPLGAPSAWYMGTCLAGYDSFGFDRSLLYEAEAKSATGEKGSLRRGEP